MAINFSNIFTCTGREGNGASSSYRLTLSGRVASAALVLIGAFAVASCGSGDRGPKPLTEFEREVAREYARINGVSVKEAEALAIEARASDADRRRWSAERSERESAGEALQLAYPD